MLSVAAKAHPVAVCVSVIRLGDHGLLRLSELYLLFWYMLRLLQIPACCAAWPALVMCNLLFHT